jgi:biopolymer transport protein ExbD
MIDVLLVLIIIFMVVVSMSNQKGLEAHIPQPAPTDARPEPARTVVIQVAWTGEQQLPTLKINDDDVKWDHLHDRLFDIFKQRAERVAFVKGDDDVDFQYVADAISIARGSGVEKIGLLTKTGPESP